MATVVMGMAAKCTPRGTSTRETGWLGGGTARVCSAAAMELSMM